jgi:hypothetical protein
MASTFAVSRSQLIYAFCLPLAVLIGYFLAEPLESGSMAIVVFVFSVLCLPILIKWYHPLLIMSWNAMICMVFMPGRPFAWMFMACVGLGIAILNRSINPNKRFIHVPTLTKPLIFLGGVVMITAVLTGGVGLNILGSSRFGGKGYLFIFAAVAGYFAMTSQRIPRERAGLYLALFFLPGLTVLVAQIAALFGPAAEFLFAIFPATTGATPQSALSPTATGPDYSRLGALAIAAPAVYGYLFARFGIRGIMDLRRPWRMVFLLLAAAACAWCGYRSAFILLILSFMAVFYWEGLHRTRWLMGLIGAGLLAGAAILPQAEKLPLVVQRTLSFLPMKVDFLVRQSSDSSTEWRLEMWKRVLPDVPKYLLHGKGYVLTADDIYWANENSYRIGGLALGATAAGDYHSGPLSTIIPFGIWGVIGLVWFWAASLRYLYRNFKFGDPDLRQINTLLISLFSVKILFFLSIFGSLYIDLSMFTGLVGFAVSLNGAPVKPIPSEAPEEALSGFSLRV